MPLEIKHPRDSLERSFQVSTLVARRRLLDYIEIETLILEHKLSNHIATPDDLRFAIKLLKALIALKR